MAFGEGVAAQAHLSVPRNRGSLRIPSDLGSREAPERTFCGGEVSRDAPVCHDMALSDGAGRATGTESLGSPIKDEAGTIVAVAILSQDVTEPVVHLTPAGEIAGSKAARRSDLRDAGAEARPGAEQRGRTGPHGSPRVFPPLHRPCGGPGRVAAPGVLQRCSQLMTPGVLAAAVGAPAAQRD
jgi:hypothetical protein